MTTGVSVKMIDRDGLQVAIKRASAPPNSRILSAVASRMRGMQMEHFESQKDSSGKAWTPLKSSTIKARRKSGAGITLASFARIAPDYAISLLASPIKMRGKVSLLGVEILQDTGKLRTSIVRYSNRDTAITGTNTIYAVTHQFGRPGGGWQGSDIPAREFIYLNEAEQKTLVEFVSNEIVGPLMKRKN